MRGRPWTARAGARSPRGVSAGGREWSATASRAASGRRRGARPAPAIRSVYWCSATPAPARRFGPVVEARGQATEGGIGNAMLAAETMTGADGLTVYALPHDRLREVLRRYNRLNP